MATAEKKTKEMENSASKPSPKRGVGRPRGPVKGSPKGKSIVGGTTKKSPRKRNTPKDLNTIPNQSTVPAQFQTPHKSPVPNSMTPVTNNVTNTYKRSDTPKKSKTKNVNPQLTPTKNLHEATDQDSTLKNSEKPPEGNIRKSNSGTFKSALEKTIDTPMTDRLSRSTFLIQKELCEAKSLPDDVSTVAKDNFTVTDYPNNIRTTMMYKLPPKSGDLSEEDAPILSIQKMNQMIKALTNKLPCKIGPWKLKDTKTKLKMTDLLSELPEDIDFVETYVYDFNRFLSLDKNGYVRLNFFYSDSTCLPEIEQVISQFKIPRTQFLEKAHSDALVPKTIGTLTGSVEAMASSKDFKDTFQYKFGLSSLGLWWGIPRQGKKSEYNSNKSVIHIEIDQKDFYKRPDIENFFNYTTSGIDNHFFGVPMLLTVPFHYFASDDEKANLAMHSRKQVSLSKAITSTTVHGVGLNNWANSKKNSTLLRELMSVESITKKHIIKAKKPTTFLGRLFYAIIPNNEQKSVTFHFTKANASEGRSVARGLPLFIRDYFRLEPAFFCTSAALTEALEGDWNYDTRKFLSAQEKMEIDRLDDMEEEVNAVQVQYISKDHQHALAMEEDDVSVETRLTKGDAAPTPVILVGDPPDEQSEMTGSTRESKAKKYAAEAVREVANEYSGTILNMSSDIEKKDDRIAQLELMLRNMHSPPSGGTKETPIDMVDSNLRAQDNEASPTEDNSLLSYSSKSYEEEQASIAETNEVGVPPDIPNQHTTPSSLVRYEGRDKRKLPEDGNLSQDDTSRSTRAKTSDANDNDDKSPSTEGADSL